MPPKKSTPVVKPEVQEVPVEKPEVVEVTTVETPQETGELTSTYADFATKLSAARSAMSTLMNDFKALQKKADRALRAAEKAHNRRKNKNANRAPSGFVKPTLISDQLADFLGKPKGSLIARTEVTREINAYIRSNKLQDPQNGRKINPDAKLKKLLVLKPTDELTYFNLQRFMSPHFQKAAPASP